MSLAPAKGVGDGFNLAWRERHQRRCFHRRLFSDVMDYLNGLSKRFAKPQIKAQFLDYERLSSFDRTGSYLAPMATTIGLYDGLELVAVAKLGTPIKITPELPINFVVKMDF